MGVHVTEPRTLVITLDFGSLEIYTIEPEVLQARILEAILKGRTEFIASCPPGANTIPTSERFFFTYEARLPR